MHNNCKGKNFAHYIFSSIEVYIYPLHSWTHIHTTLYTHTICDRKLIPSSSVLNFVNTAWVDCTSLLCCTKLFLLNIFFCPKHVYISNDNCIYKLWHAHYPSGTKLCADQLIKSCDWRYLMCIINTCYNEKVLSYRIERYVLCILFLITILVFQIYRNYFPWKQKNNCKRISFFPIFNSTFIIVWSLKL